MGLTFLPLHLTAADGNAQLRSINISITVDRFELAMAPQVNFENNVSVLDREGALKTATGAIWDLKGDADGIGGGLSTALQALADPASPQVPTALIAAQMGASNLIGLVFLEILTLPVSKLCPGAVNGTTLSPLLQKLSGRGIQLSSTTSQVMPWSRSSSQFFQVGGPNSSGHYLAQNVVHSKGMLKLNFTGPVELDQASGIPQKVIDLLNSPLSVFYPGLPH
jgi:hypothetical protein